MKQAWLKEPYVLINFILVILILFPFVYSFFYAALAQQGLTVQSQCQGMPEVYCRSRGLSRAFYHLMHFNFERAAQLNRYAFSVFIFFAIEMIARIILSLAYLKSKNNRIILVDSILSALYFVYTFLPMTAIYYLVWEKK